MSEMTKGDDHVFHQSCGNHRALPEGDRAGKDGFDQIDLGWFFLDSPCRENVFRVVCGLIVHVDGLGAEGVRDPYSNDLRWMILDRMLVSVIDGRWTTKGWFCLWSHFRSN